MQAYYRHAVALQMKQDYVAALANATQALKHCSSTGGTRHDIEHLIATLTATKQADGSPVQHRPEPASQGAPDDRPPAVAAVSIEQFVQHTAPALKVQQDEHHGRMLVAAEDLQAEGNELLTERPFAAVLLKKHQTQVGCSQ